MPCFFYYKNSIFLKTIFNFIDRHHFIVSMVQTMSLWSVTFNFVHIHCFEGGTCFRGNNDFCFGFQPFLHHGQINNSCHFHWNTITLTIYFILLQSCHFWNSVYNFHQQNYKTVYSCKFERFSLKLWSPPTDMTV